MQRRLALVGGFQCRLRVLPSVDDIINLREMFDLLVPEAIPTGEVLAHVLNEEIVNLTRYPFPSRFDSLLGLCRQLVGSRGRQQSQKPVRQARGKQFVRMQRAFTVHKLMKDASLFPVPVGQWRVAQLRIDDRIRSDLIRDGEHALCDEEAKQVTGRPQVLCLARLGDDIKRLARRVVQVGKELALSEVHGNVNLYPVGFKWRGL